MICDDKFDIEEALREDLTVQQKFAATRREMDAALIERSGEIDVVLTAMVCRKNPLLVGPPGTAKSLLLETIMHWMNGRKFPILFTKFTTPEEVFGPISVMGLKSDKYRRITTGRLPEADVAFGDEIFKASSAILNTLLKILNERTYDNGEGVDRPIPLRLFVAASNEWPGSEEGGKELGALFDRFLFRKTVRPVVGAAGRKRLLWDADKTPKLSTSITPAEIDTAHTVAMSIPWTKDAMDALETIMRELAAEGIMPGDRRTCWAPGAAMGFAFLSGDDCVRPDHLEILAHVLWDEPVEQPDKAAQVIAKIANPVGMRVNSLLLEAEGILAACDSRQLAQAASATSKLQEIAKQLEGIPGGNGRAVKALAYVRSQVKAIKLASIESL